MEKSKIVIRLFIVLLYFPLICLGQSYVLVELASGENTSLRGLSVVSEEVAWVSGSNGTVAKTKDGGKNWTWIRPKGYEKLDFRDVEAFDADHAIIMNAGSPAYVLITSDGGVTWKESYKNVDPAIFLDGMDFWDETKGMIFGDPIGNKMQLLRTTNGGQSWEDVSANLTLNMAIGEAGFAASGTTVKTLGSGQVWIATGGSVSNIYYSADYGKNWKVFKCPILTGESSTGAFSIDFYSKRTGIVVGGNYLKDKENANNVLLTRNGGKTWKKPLTPVSGYRSAVAYIDGQRVIATGSSGTDFSNDGGVNWTNISQSNFNAVQKDPSGDLVILAGNRGQIYKLVNFKK